MKPAKMTAFLLVLMIVFGINAVSLAGDFPDRPIRWIIPYAAGGGTDTLARAFQVPFEAALGTKLIIENIPAGTTKIATLEALKAKADGYTIIMMTTEGWVAYFYSGTYDFKVWDKLTCIGNLTSEPYGFVEVRAESPFKTWADLVKAGMEKPGQLTCGGPGAGGMMELIMNTITQAAGIKSKYVPFQGAGPSRIAMLGGHVDFRVCQPTEAITMIRAGKTRGLAVSTEERMEALPDVPTFKELGIGTTIDLTRGIWGPPDLSPELANFISKAIEKASKDPNFVKVIQEDLLYTVDYRPGEKLLKHARDFNEAWGPKLEESYQKK